MNLFKLLPLITILLFSFSLYILDTSTKAINYKPLSSKDIFFQKLEDGLRTLKIDYTLVESREFNNEIELIFYYDSTPVRVILSSQLNPYWQLASLQEIFKLAKIKSKTISVIDLSLAYPYATFQNR